MFADDLGRALARLDHDVTTASLQRSTDAAPLPAVILGDGRRDLGTWSALLGAIRAHDVTIAHGGPSLIPVAAASAAGGRPFVYRNIGDPTYWGDVPLATLRVGVPMRRAAGVVALYEGARDHLVRRYHLDPRRMTIASNAVDLRRFRRRDEASRRDARRSLGIHDDEPVVLYLGALSPEKQPDLAIDVATGVDSTVLLMAGTGPLHDEASRRAAEHGAARVRLLGSWDRPAELLTAADVLLITSRTEGVPGCLLEALAVGTPVVATDVGGVGEVLRSLGGGIPVAEGPEVVDDLRTAVREILRRPLGAADRLALASAHGIDAIAARYDGAITRALRPR